VPADDDVLAIEWHISRNERAEGWQEMKLLRGVITGGGIAAFFFFSWIIQLLWNAILVDQLALVAVRVSYWQAAALWFLSIIFFAWAGIGVSPTMSKTWRRFLD